MFMWKIFQKCISVTYILQEGQTDALLLLLSLGAEINSCDSKGRTGKLTYYNNLLYFCVQFGAL